MQGAANEYVVALAHWLPVETLRLFDRTRRFDCDKNYDLSCAAGLPGSVKSDKYLQSFKAFAMKDVRSELKSISKQSTHMSH